ncbi:hypothetical protein [Novosphingobium album (ex Hu et al. 2023)]|uniref:Uncharacterized protein n=1 Tax=Novosphingobium album (ex Hu et al. 2023) TaxID=2930093 RepID=A0ABT0B5S7_9SPHN|nr:hypothetical protein [Novosphingobium album (ex Hu et al. 2023)]MCJ2180213.1 hypothetical protein [Novosphingobium album (ex Hu et al. 2023)]
MDGISFEALPAIAAEAHLSFGQSDALAICRRGGTGPANDFGGSVLSKCVSNTETISIFIEDCRQCVEAAANSNEILWSPRPSDVLSSSVSIPPVEAVSNRRFELSKLSQLPLSTH